MTFGNQQNLLEVFYLFSGILDTPVSMGNWELDLKTYLLAYKKKKDLIDSLLNNKDYFDKDDPDQRTAYWFLQSIDCYCNSDAKKKNDRLDLSYRITKLAFQIFNFMQEEHEFLNFFERKEFESSISVLMH